MAILLSESLSAVTTFNITLNSLGGVTSAVGRESTVVDNSTTKYLDAICQVNVATMGTAPTNDSAIYVYAYGANVSNNFTYPATGTDNAITLVAPTCMPLVAVIPYAATTTASLHSSPFSIASAFGGALPNYWGIAVVNFCGSALSTDSATHPIGANWVGLAYSST